MRQRNYLPVLFVISIMILGTLIINNTSNDRLPDLVQSNMNEDEIEPFHDFPEFNFVNSRSVSGYPEGVWTDAVKAGGTSDEEAYDISLDASGNALIVGSFMGTASFGNHTLTSAGGKDVYVAKLSPTGQWLWATSVGGSSTDEGVGIAIDSSGDAFVTGHFSSASISFGSTSLTNSQGSGDYDAFTAKINSNGTWLWADKIGFTGSDYGTDVDVDASGNAYFTGHFRSTSLNINGTSLANTGSNSYDVYIAVSDNNGYWQWAIRAGGSYDDKSWGVAADQYGYAYITGGSSNTVTFGPSTFNGGGAFVAKAAPNATWVQANIITSAEGSSLDVDSSGNIFVFGTYQNTASFGTIQMTSRGAEDAYLARLSSTNQWQWVENISGQSTERGYDLELDGRGYGIVTGIFSSTSTYIGNTILQASTEEIYVAMFDDNGTWVWVEEGGAPFGYAYGRGIAADGQGGIVTTGYSSSGAVFGNHTLTNSGNWDIFVAHLSSDTDGDSLFDANEDCFDAAGNSSFDRTGCPDSDGDGYSDPDQGWTISNGADAFPNDGYDL